ncbi:hypothetical protein RUM43_009174 [Polyplax serrata]|uniref:Uncharacterized protein n=1 Tax=Polyplax serrata TaxID=468196 RepID=A0AAN8NVL6_POLSC
MLQAKFRSEKGKRYKRYLSVVTKPKLGFPQHPLDSGDTLLDNSHEANIPRMLTTDENSVPPQPINSPGRLCGVSCWYRQEVPHRAPFPSVFHPDALPRRPRQKNLIAFFS